MIAIVDYGVGNLHSVLKAMEKTGAQVCVTSDKDVIKKADKLILPGVGSFGHCMKNLRACGLENVVKEFADSGRPFLGICVGLQILFEASEESPGVSGLGFLKGKIVRLPEAGLKIPQIGWNNLAYKKESPLFKGLTKSEYVYFVHSYYAQPEDAGIITATVDYGAGITASVASGNIQATQFHPEKSGDVGLQILANFKEL